MKSQTSIKKNFIYQMIYQILIIILPFVTSPYIARTIGAEGLGTYSYSYNTLYAILLNISIILLPIVLLYYLFQIFK